MKTVSAICVLYSVWDILVNPENRSKNSSYVGFQFCGQVRKRAEIAALVSGW